MWQPCIMHFFKFGSSTINMPGKNWPPTKIILHPMILWCYTGKPSTYGALFRPFAARCVIFFPVCSRILVCSGNIPLFVQETISCLFNDPCLFKKSFIVCSRILVCSRDHFLFVQGSLFVQEQGFSEQTRILEQTRIS